MGTLRLTIIVGGYDDHAEDSRVITNIFDVTEKHIVRKNTRKLVIPLGSTRDIPLDPGEYIVEALLPSGQSVKEEISIREQVGPQDLVLRSESTPHEWLGWQQYAGNVRERWRKYEEDLVSLERIRGLKEEEKKEKSEVYHLIIPASARRIETPRKEIDSLLEGHFYTVKTGTPEKTEIESIHKLLTTPAIRNEKLQPSAKSRLLEFYYFGSSGYSSGMRYDVPSFDRHYLLVTGDKIPTQYCVLPVPWRKPETDEFLGVEVLLRTPLSSITKGTPESGHLLSIAVRDPLITSVLGYSRTGKLSEAEIVLETASDFLLRKIMNPLAAAAGSYVLLATEKLDEKKDWNEWVYNLMSLFPWLPDGAIQYGWLQLNKSNMEKARNALLDGFRRGVPYYSRGVRMLLDGLTAIARNEKENNTRDRQVDEALSTVRELALRINMQQPFTTVLF